MSYLRMRAALLTAAALFPSMATAQESPATDRTSIADIVVTAQRRSASLYDVPAAVSAVDANTLERGGGLDTRKLQFAVPGLVVTHETGLNTQVYIRGVGNNISGIGASNSVATYVDGVYIPNSLQVLQSFNDVERIEVLKGPQAVLYGRNATGGAINVISRAPSFDVTGEGEASYGNYDAYMIRGTVSGPIIPEKLAVRVAGVTSYHRGYDVNAFNNKDIDREKVYGLRGSILANLSEHVSLTWRGDYSYLRTADYLKAVNPDANYYILSSPSQYIPDPRRVYNDTQGKATMHDIGTNATLKIETGIGDITTVGSYRNFKSGPNYSDLNSLSIPFVENGRANSTSRRGERFGSKSTYLETYLASNKWGPVSLIAGVNYFHEDATNANRAFTNVASANDRFGKTKAYAAYGDVTLAISDRLSVSAGLRYSTEKRFYEQRALNPVTLVETGRVSNRATFKDWSPRAGVEFRPSDGQLFYFNYTTGFKSGGFNEGNPLDDFLPESIKSYEAGWKGRLGSDIRVSLSGFYYDYKDLQISRFNTQTSTREITNAGSATLYGLDAEALWQATSRLRLTGSLSLLHSEYGTLILCDAVTVACTITQGGRTVINPAGQKDYKGTELARAPKATASATVNYELPLDEIAEASGKLSFFVRGSYRSKMNFGPFGLPVHEGDAYFLLDGEIRYSAPSDWYVAIYGNNLTNEFIEANLPTSSASFSPTGVLLANAARFVRPAPPRTYGVRVGIKF